MSEVSSRPCWQRSPRHLPPLSIDTFQIRTVEDLNSQLADNPDSKVPLLFFSSPKNPHRLLLAAAMNRLAKVYKKEILFCVIDLNLSNDTVSHPIAELYEIELDDMGVVALIEDGKVKDKLVIPFKSEKAITENWIRGHLGMELMDDPGLGFGGFFKGRY